MKFHREEASILVAHRWDDTSSPRFVVQTSFTHLPVVDVYISQTVPSIYLLFICSAVHPCYSSNADISSPASAWKIILEGSDVLTMGSNNEKQAMLDYGKRTANHMYNVRTRVLIMDQKLAFPSRFLFVLKIER